MRETLFLLADLWMIFVGYFYGWKLIRRYGNYLLGLELMVVATSGSNFLLWSLLGANSDSVMYDVAYFFDAFSRSVGITVILIMGLMKVTHRYEPSPGVDVGVFAAATVAGLFLRHFHGADLHTDRAAFAVAVFYVVVNLLTAVFLGYFVKRLLAAGARWPAIWTGLVTAAGTTIAITYDLFPLPFDDAHRTIFYTAALATWGTQGFVYFRAYRALHDHNAASDAKPAHTKEALA
ncbi:transporter [Streptomyces griseofuscus]|uniref:Transporter n=1 Tax=Streptomyces griseofuscus TaxID=146922 RepID=A0A3R8RFN1_9ACTN|nr:transporter [Streptomyces griseofuscus]RRQ79999.1 transporter [Streptomyces griseofuscus]